MRYLTLGEVVDLHRRLLQATAMRRSTSAIHASSTPSSDSASKLSIRGRIRVAN